MQKKIRGLFFIVFFQFALLISQFSLASNSLVQEKNIPDSQPSTQSELQQEKSDQKGGVYSVGREFKEAGQEIKTGGAEVGKFFTKVGRSVKSFFTGEKENNNQNSSQQSPAKSDPLDHRGDDTK